MLRLALFLCCLALPAHAVPVAVRSGEHADFSRLVVMLPKGAQWKVEPRADGYRLESKMKNPEFQLQDVFRLIPRTRLERVQSDAAAGGLLFETAKGVEVRSFQLRLGGVVLDFYDAPAPVEVALDSKSPPVPAPHSVHPVPIGAAHLDLYWSGLVADPEPSLSNNQRATPRTPVTDEAPLSVPPIERADERVTAVEVRLRQELARAASQGLIEIEMPKLPKPVEVEGPSPDAPTPEAQDEAPDAHYQTHDHIAFKSETSIDQARPSGHPALGRTENGLRCAPDSLFDLGAWMRDGDASDQIGEGRRAVMGEFDRPNQDEVIKLARTYLSFGFGAESRALLRDMGEPGYARDALMYLADLFDEQLAARRSPFAQMVGCDGYVSVWALLGADPLPSKEDVNFAAVQRTYLGLSPQLRQTIGPDLVARLIAIDAPDIARAIRPALSRITVEDQSALDMVDAQLTLQEGGDDADHALAKVVAKDGTHAADALLLLVDDKLSHGQAINSATTQNARALAFELRGGPAAYRLLRAAVMGHASVGEFDEAIALMTDWPRGAEPELRTRTRGEMVGLLAKHPNNGIFLRNLFANWESVVAAAKRDDLRFELADRLIKLGFEDTATPILAQASPPGDKDLLLMGKAALASRDAAAALTHLEGIAGPEAEQLRARALALIGEHGAAQIAYSNVSDPEGALREAWRDGDWDFVRDNAVDTERDFVETFAPKLPALDSAAKPSGPLAHAEALINASEKERKIFQEMLGKFSVPGAEGARSSGLIEDNPTN
ncbi:hypothetical protein [Thioclava sp.]|uniref:hypothetical protein n=1 Tax=Thioclava sp. TaxID=1933450 RepID=UPI003AA97B3C